MRFFTTSTPRVHLDKRLYATSAFPLCRVQLHKRSYATSPSEFPRAYFSRHPRVEETLMQLEKLCDTHQKEYFLPST